MKYPWAYKGNKVICINDSFFEASKYDLIIPQYKKTYTIKEVRVCDNDCGLIFDEIQNKNMSLFFEDGSTMYGEVSFNVNQFKPLEKKSLMHDIDIFQKILDRSPEKVG